MRARSARQICIGVFCALALTLGLAGTSSASAPTSAIKTFDACLQNADTGSPTGCTAGANSVLPAGATAHLSLTLTNTSANQSLGSANLDAPSGLIVDPGSASASQGSIGAGTSSSELQLRNLGLAPGDSMAVTFDVTTPCSGSGLAWSIEVKQANDFNGVGNDFSPATESGLVSDISSGGCLHIAFVNQPDRTAIGNTITTAPYSSGSAIEVGLYDNTDTLVSSCPTTTCTATISASPSLGILGGTLHEDFAYDATAGGLIASFGDLSISGLDSSNLPQTFTLNADALGSDATSDPFQVDLSGVSCAGLDPCNANPVTVGNSVISGSAQGGNFVYVGIDKLDFGYLPAGCQTLTGEIGAPMVILDQRDSVGGELFVTYGVNKSLITKKYSNTKGQQFMPICAGAMRIALDPLTGKTVSVPCNQTYNGVPQTPWLGKKLDANGNFDQTAVAPAVCDAASGYFFGILGSFQDYTGPNKSLIINGDTNPTVTSWTSDTVYRYFAIRFPSSSGTGFAGDPWDGWVFG